MKVEIFFFPSRLKHPEVPENTVNICGAFTAQMANTNLSKLLAYQNRIWNRAFVSMCKIYITKDAV